MLYVMLLIGMLISALVLGGVLADFTPLRLIQVVQGAALVTMVLNMVALWKQEVRDPALTHPDKEHISFGDAWHSLKTDPRTVRLLIAVGLGAAGLQYAGCVTRALWR